MLNRLNYRPEDRLAIAEELALEDIEQFAAELYGQVFIEALVHGNISDEKTIELTRKLQKKLGVRTIDPLSTGEAAAGEAQESPGPAMLGHC